MKVIAGWDVKFEALHSKHVFYGRVLRTYPEHALVEDRSGEPPRLVSMDRLEPFSGGGRMRFTGRSA